MNIKMEFVYPAIGIVNKSFRFFVVKCIYFEALQHFDFKYVYMEGVKILKICQR